MLAVKPDLATAFDRIDDFLAVQGAAPAREAVLALEEAVGLDDESRAVIRGRVAALTEAGHGLGRPGHPHRTVRCRIVCVKH
jgi:hypothetical protein